MSSKHRIVVLKVVGGELSVTQAAAEYGMSRQYLHKLHARYRDEGLDGLEPRSRAPLTSPQAVTERVRDRVVELRHALTVAGTDDGPVTVAWHLEREGLRAPSTSTIRRIHLGIGVAHRGAPVLLIADDTTVTVVHQRTGEIIATNTIDPDKTYWRNQVKEPGRWPGSFT